MLRRLLTLALTLCVAFGTVLADDSPRKPDGPRSPAAKPAPRRPTNAAAGERAGEARKRAETARRAAAQRRPAARTSEEARRRAADAQTRRTAASSSARHPDQRQPNPKALFERLDRNRDRLLNLDEFAAGIGLFSQPGRALRDRDDAKRSAPDDAKVVVYTVDGVDSKRSFYVMRFLTSQFPEANFTMATEPAHLVVRARPKDHEGIAGLLEEMNRKTLEESPRAALYTLGVVNTTFVSEVLGAAVPEAELTLDSENPQRFVAWARPSEHSTIVSILKEIDVEPPPEAALQVKVYDTGVTTGSTAMLLLQHMAPQAMMSWESSQLIVWARAKDHESIVRLLEVLAEQVASPAAEPK